ncbi:class I SAM-dependent methyltransferase [Legionella waltersii]|nr:class I SAM-dependent methyltransferase [Legionella waltersii]
MMTEENQGTCYDRIAADFAKMRDSFYKEQKYLDLLISYLQPNAHILDVGCGSGNPIASYLIKKGFRVTGVDGSKELLTIAALNCPTMHTVCGDGRTVVLNEQYDALLEWWCLFHVPKQDHEKMIARFAKWLKKDGLLEFTSGDAEYEARNSDMLNQELYFASLSVGAYEKALKENGFELLLREYDQEHHLVWMARKK